MPTNRMQGQGRGAPQRGGMQQQQSALSQLINSGALQAAHEAHKADETEYSQFGELPAGIENGIAELRECKFDVYKKGDNVGKPYFYAAGIVVAPKELGGVPIEGLRTQITEAVCDTPGKSRETVDAHIAWVYNELRKLGVQTERISSVAELEPTLAALVAARPHFRFRTWKGQKQETGPYANQEPRTQHTWNGQVAWTPPADDGVQDNTEPAPEPPEPVKRMDPVRANGARASTMPVKPTTPAPKTPARPATPAPARPTPSKPAPAPKPATPPLPPASSDEAPFDEFEGLNELLALAKDEDDDAQNKLTQMATDVGYSEEEVSAMTDWESVVEAIVQAGPGDAPPAAGDEGNEAGVWTPQVGEVYLYHPINPRTKKPMPKAVECEVTTVQDGAGTVMLKNLDDNKTIYKDVKWESLEVQDQPA